MGTAISVHVTDPLPGPRRQALVDEAFDWLRLVDRRFSTYLPDSEVCRLERGELAPGQGSDSLRYVLDACARLWRETDGYFDAQATGRLDPSGFVKGWSVQVASDRLVAAGAAEPLRQRGRGRAGTRRARAGPAVADRHPAPVRGAAGVLRAGRHRSGGGDVGYLRARVPRGRPVHRAAGAGAGLRDRRRVPTSASPTPTRPRRWPWARRDCAGWTGSTGTSRWWSPPTVGCSGRSGAARGASTTDTRLVVDVDQAAVRRSRSAPRRRAPGVSRTHERHLRLRGRPAPHVVHPVPGGGAPRHEVGQVGRCTGRSPPLPRW